MKTLKAAVAAIAIIGFAGTAQAQDNDVYGNLGVDSYDFDSFGIGAKLGTTFQDYFGAEVQGTIGITDDEFTIFGDTIEAKVDFGVAGFAVLRSPVGDDFAVFVRGGYHYTEASAKLNGVDLGSVSDDGFAAGIGGEYMFNASNGIRAEYTYMDFSESDSSGDLFSLSYVRKF